MIANPADLRVGRGTAVSSGDEAAIAVVRLRADSVKPLPDSSITGVHVSGAGAGQSAPAAGPNAADPTSPSVAANNSGGSGS